MPDDALMQLVRSARASVQPAPAADPLMDLVRSARASISGGGLVGPPQSARSPITPGNFDQMPGYVEQAPPVTLADQFNTAANLYRQLSPPAYRGIVGEAGAGLAESALGTGRALAGGLTFAGDLVGSPGLTQAGRDVSAGVGMVGAPFEQAPDAGFGTKLIRGAAGLPLTLAKAASAGAIAGPVGVAGVFGAEAAANKYDQLRHLGPELAGQGAAQSGALNATLGAVAPAGAVGLLPKAAQGAATNAAVHALASGASLAGTGLAERAIDYTTGQNPEAFKGAGEQAAVDAVLGALMPLPGEAAGAYRARAMRAVEAERIASRDALMRARGEGAIVGTAGPAAAPDSTVNGREVGAPRYAPMRQAETGLIDFQVPESVNGTITDPNRSSLGPARLARGERVGAGRTAEPVAAEAPAVSEGPQRAADRPAVAEPGRNGVVDLPAADRAAPGGAAPEAVESGSGMSRDTYNQEPTWAALAREVVAGKRSRTSAQKSFQGQGPGGDSLKFDAAFRSLRDTGKLDVSAIESSVDSRPTQAEAARASLNEMVASDKNRRDLRDVVSGRPGWTVDHQSDSGSLYAKHEATGKVVRLSDHYVPEDETGNRSARQPWTEDFVSRSWNLRGEFEKAADSIERSNAAPEAVTIEDQARQYAADLNQRGREDAVAGHPVDVADLLPEEKRAYLEGYREGKRTARTRPPEPAPIAPSEPQPVEATKAPQPESRPAPVETPQPARPAQVGESGRPVEGAAVVASVDDIDSDLAVRAHSGTSHSPERRGEYERNQYVAIFDSVAKKLRDKATTPEQKAEVESELARFREGLKAKYVAKLAAQSRQLSPMITGPARFPVESNAKKIRSADKRRDELNEFIKNAERSINNRLFPEAAKIVSSDVPNAPDILAEKITKAENLQRLMVAVNKVVRSKIPDGEKITAIQSLGLKESTARKLLEPDFLGRKGFPDYELKNNLAEIKRMRGRVTEISTRRISDAREAEFDGGKVVENKDANRVQILYDEKPAEDIRRVLKSKGFRWSPSEGAWQRLGNEAGWRAALEVTGARSVPKPIEASSEPSKPAATAEPAKGGEVGPKPEAAKAPAPAPEAPRGEVPAEETPDQRSARIKKYRETVKQDPRVVEANAAVTEAYGKLAKASISAFADPQVMRANGRDLSKKSKAMLAEYDRVLTKSIEVEKAVRDEFKAKEAGGEPSSTLDKLHAAADAAEKKARESLKKSIPRGRGAGATTLPSDIYNSAVIVAAKVIKGGVRSVQAVVRAYKEAARELGWEHGEKDSKKVHDEARRIVAQTFRKAASAPREVGDKVAIGLAPEAKGKPPRRITGTITEVNGDTYTVDTKDATIEVKASEILRTMKDAQSDAVAFEQAVNASRMRFGVDGPTNAKMARESTSKLIGRYTGTADTSDPTTQRKALAAVMRGQRDAAGRAWREAVTTMRADIRQKMQYEKHAQKGADALLESVRTGIINTAKKLPGEQQGAFLTKVRDAKSVRDLVRVVNDVQQKLDRNEYVSAAKSVRDFSRDRLLALSANKQGESKSPREVGRALVAEAAELRGQVARGEIKSDDARQRMRDIDRELKVLEHEAKLENKITQDGKAKDATESRDKVVASLARHPELKMPDAGATNPNRLVRAIRSDFDPTTFTSMVDGNWGEKVGEVRRLTVEEPFKAREKAYAEHRAGLEKIEGAVRSAGYNGVSDWAAKWYGTRGKANTKFVDVSIGGRKLTVGEAAALVAMDPATRDKTLAGLEWSFDDNQTTAHRVTAANLEEALNGLSREDTALVRKLKNIMQEFRPRLDELHRTMHGVGLDDVADYFPTHRNTKLAKQGNLPKAYRGAVAANHYENAGMLQQRTGGDTPMILRNMVPEVMQYVQSVSRILHLSEPIRNAEVVLLDRSVKDAIGKRFGEVGQDRIQDIIADASVDRAPDPGIIGQMFAKIGRNSARTKVQLNPGTWLRQIGGIGTAATKIHPADLAAGLKASSNIKLESTIEDAVPYFWNRWRQAAYAAQFTGMESSVTKPSSSGLSELGDSAKAAMRSGKGLSNFLGEVQDAVPIGGWADAVPARFLWGAFEHQVNRENPTWSSEKKKQWVADQTVRAFRETQNTTGAGEDTGMTRMLKRNPFTAPITSFRADTVKKRQMLYQAAAKGPREVIKASAGILASMAWSYGVSYGTSALMYGAINKATGRKPSDNAEERFWDEAASMIPFIGQPLRDIYKAATGTRSLPNVGDYLGPAVGDTQKVLEGAVAAIQAGLSREGGKDGVLSRGEKTRAAKLFIAMEKMLGGASGLGGVGVEPLWRMFVKPWLRD